uniref:Uncharacterized protein n=1 Tax=Heterorhabditis bacteriophora TaxID=37862 RepID=A0A1I7X1A2_HETBA
MVLHLALLLLGVVDGRFIVVLSLKVIYIS